MLRKRKPRKFDFAWWGSGWYAHIPGDPMPCDPAELVNYLLLDDMYVNSIPIMAEEEGGTVVARELNWSERLPDNQSAAWIVGWKYAD